MSETRLGFHIVDVFTPTKYLGNQLAIVHVPTHLSSTLTQKQKLLIAREFNLSETVFMHDNPPDAKPEDPVRVDIFTTEEELPFAGHPTNTMLAFRTIDVFTDSRYVGNPLAIVHVPAPVSASLTQEQKQRIAREFNLSETVFMHANPPEAPANAPVRIDIFTTTEELPFAGHPTVGSSWYLLRQSSSEKISKIVTLRTRAGDIPAALQDSGKVRLQVPVDFKEHNSIKLPWYKSGQPNLQAVDFASGDDGEDAVASIVKGMTFVLLRVTSEDALKGLVGIPRKVEVGWLGDWQGFVGVYAFYEREDGVVRTRMFDGTLEDPATGSAASTLAGWLARKKGPGHWKFEIVQGVEMGRRSDIEVQVDVGSDGEVTKIELGGEAVEVMEGTIVV